MNRSAHIFRSSFTKAYIWLFYLLMIPIPLAYLLFYLVESKAKTGIWIEYIFWYMAALGVAVYCAFYRKFKYKAIIVRQDQIELQKRPNKTIVLERADISDIECKILFALIKLKDGKSIFIDLGTVTNFHDRSMDLGRTLSGWLREESQSLNET